MPFTDKEKQAASREKWVANNPERAKASSRAAWRRYYAKNKEKLNERGRLYNRSHAEELKAKSAAYKKLHPESPEKKRAQRLKYFYGMTPADFDALFKKQDGKCAICGTNKFNGYGPVVDHDHVTGKVRGILCSNCNAMIGHAHDDTFVLEAAASYLRRGE